MPHGYYTVDGHYLRAFFYFPRFILDKYYIRRSTGTIVCSVDSAEPSSSVSLFTIDGSKITFMLLIKHLLNRLDKGLWILLNRR